ncbi:MULTISPECIES: hypothetical protein [Caulobacter]|jgi:hypothetical protein|uniref:Uncharacterized protein n=1 Tax=Caulobacter rhizosphaerae TaxID=2010972 RepID=A0ABU1MU70_9CAUL|nr:MULTISPECIES: hypothetical protein [Caulobacter]MDR6529735.1 hypothetical protein [Caulobacter rhizosphaerae]GGL48688.1 hypothetical protein GCM10010983_52470 [Caulobacter rhizosphaerae]
MVFLTAGSGWLALMMRAERTRAGHEPPAAEWLLRDSETIEDDEPPTALLAAE